MDSFHFYDNIGEVTKIIEMQINLLRQKEPLPDIIMSQYKHTHLKQFDAKEQNEKFLCRNEATPDIRNLHTQDLKKTKGTVNSVVRNSQRLPSDIKNRMDLKMVIESIIENANRDTPKLIESRQTLSLGKKYLEEIYDMIHQRMIFQKRNREEMIKYIMRKFLRFMRINKQTIQRDRDLKELSTEFLEVMGGLDLPFRSESQIKTMNQSFLKKIFSSKDIQDKYNLFLENLQSLIEEDNSKKISMFKGKLSTIFEKSRDRREGVKKLKQIKRIPWTKSSLEQLTQLAVDLRRNYF